MSESKQILALYDCRSKQEYIYRTNRMQEITGGSELLKDVFNGFFTDKNHGFKISCDWDKYLSIPENYLENFRLSGFDAEIIYEGGGNLCVIFKDKETYLKINHVRCVIAPESASSLLMWRSNRATRTSFPPAKSCIPRTLCRKTSALTTPSAA